MKKILVVILFFCGAVLAFAHTVSAQAVVPAPTACPSGNDGDCPGDQVCDTSVKPYACVANDAAGKGNGDVQTGGKCAIDGDCFGNLACILIICQIDPSLEDPGTATAGGQCGQPDANGQPVTCPGTQTCDTSQTPHVCVGPTGSASPTTGAGFVPLAPIPGLTQGAVANSSGLIAFLQNLYKYLIGLAAILAVIYIIWGGIEIATQDIPSMKTDGRKKITDALFGLVLVLAPVIVFTIINPAILNLNVNLPALNTKTGTWQSVSVDQNIKCASGGDCTDAVNKCNSLGTGMDSSISVCIKGDGTVDDTVPKNCVQEAGSIPVPCSTDCKSNETYGISCVGDRNSNAAGQAGADPSNTNIIPHDFSFMDLVQFVGPDQATVNTNALNYKCQGGQDLAAGLIQTALTFTCSKPNCEYVFCVSALDYVVIPNGGGGYYTAPEFTDKANTFKGECSSVANILSSDNANQSATFSYLVSTNTATCTDADKALGKTCFQARGTCSIK